MAWRVRCHACATDLESEDPVGRSARCLKCGSDLRCCRNCRFYDLSAYNECAEPSAERVLDKERANFCDYFAPDAGDRLAATTSGPQPDGLSDLQKLFRKP